MFFSFRRLVPLVFVFALTTLDAQEEAPKTLAQEKAAYQKADANLNNAWKATKAALGEWEYEKLQEEQREWLEFRDQSAKSAAFYDEGREYEGREEEANAFWSTRTHLTETRTRMIKAWESESGSDPDWNGVWTDGYGGWIHIATDESGGKLHFHLEVVRGPTYHLGVLDGIARLNDPMAFFSDKGSGEKNPEDPETWLVFEKGGSGPQLKLSAVNSQYYHGVRAYFQGTYTRVDDLSEKERRDLFESKD